MMTEETLYSLRSRNISRSDMEMNNDNVEFVSENDTFTEIINENVVEVQNTVGVSEEFARDNVVRNDVESPTVISMMMTLFTELRADMNKNNNELKADLKADFNKKLDEQKTDMNKNNNELRADLKTDFNKKFDKLDKDINKRFDEQDRKLEAQSKEYDELKKELTSRIDQQIANCLNVREELVGMIDKNKVEMYDTLNQKCEDIKKTCNKDTQEKLEIVSDQLNEDMNNIKYSILSLNHKLDSEIKTYDSKIKKAQDENTHEIQEMKNKISTLESEFHSLTVTGKDVTTRITSTNPGRSEEEDTMRPSPPRLISALQENNQEYLQNSSNKSVPSDKSVPVISYDYNNDHFPPSTVTSSYNNNNICVPRDLEVRSALQIDFPMPTFSDPLKENPVVFIQELESYFVIKQVPESLKMTLTGKSLISESKSWFNVITSSYDKSLSFDKFKLLFLTHYWSNERQSMVRNEISHGKYNEKLHGNLIDYFLSLVEKSKFLIPPLSEMEIINFLAQHFNDTVRASIIVSKPRTILETLDLLRSLQTYKKPNEQNKSVFGNGFNSDFKLKRVDGEIEKHKQTGNFQSNYNKCPHDNYYSKDKHGDCKADNGKDNFNRGNNNNYPGNRNRNCNSNEYQKPRNFYSNTQKGYNINNNRSNPYDYSRRKEYMNQNQDLSKKSQEAHIRFLRTYNGNVDNGNRRFYQNNRQTYRGQFNENHVNDYCNHNRPLHNGNDSNCYCHRFNDRYVNNQSQCYPNDLNEACHSSTNNNNKSEHSVSNEPKPMTEKMVQTVLTL